MIGAVQYQLCLPDEYEGFPDQNRACGTITVDFYLATLRNDIDSCSGAYGKLVITL